MLAKTQLSDEEYLATSFEDGDRELVNGEIVERNVGEYAHGDLQLRLGAVFLKLGERVPLHPSSEQRIRVAPQKYRVADLAVYDGPEPTQGVPDHPPLVVVEIVSRKDAMLAIVEKLTEYRAIGVAHVWLADPWLRKLYVYDDAGLRETPVLEVNEYGIQLTGADIF